ncbi:MAG: YeeE/YedE family protein [Candidatus Coatesbacteria bacterium]|nr:YeeE/YedE family protein [Candidatus Coatesbacteria bacterium]
MTLFWGIIAGLLAGFLMQRSRVIRYDKQVGAMRLADMTIIKFMLTAAITASVGIYMLHDLGVVKLSVKPTLLGANIIGGLIFGIGWGIVGYCPGTAVGALGEGRWDAVWGLIGMVFGAGVFAAVYPSIKKSVLKWGDFGKITIPDVLCFNHWLLIAVLLVLYLMLFRWLENKNL